MSYRNFKFKTHSESVRNEIDSMEFKFILNINLRKSINFVKREAGIDMPLSRRVFERKASLCQSINYNVIATHPFLAGLNARD